MRNLNRAVLLAGCVLLFPLSSLAQVSADVDPEATKILPTMVVEALPEEPAPTKVEGAAQVLPVVQVTATREPTPVAVVPSSITVITGKQLRLRGANDLRSALALAPGIEVGSGGDGGPASSVPSLWGLREFDAFLLVVDGVPSGGAFNPALATLDLHNVQRIEIERGAAPVMYGATSFVGVIHVIHYGAGEADQTARGGYGGPAGAYRSGSGSGAVVLSDRTVRQSVAVDADNRAFADPKAGYQRGHLLYRAGTYLLGGELHLDADGSFQNQQPTSAAPGSTTTADGFDPTVKRDVNYNPSDARQNTQRGQVNLGYSRSTFVGEWSTLASYDHSNGHNIRGTIAPYCAEHLPTNGRSENACGYEQFTRLSGLYADTHLFSELFSSLHLTTGIDYLNGRGRQNSEVFTYIVDPKQGGAGPRSNSVPQETNELTDRRNFYGAYLQLSYQPIDSLVVLGGVRYNRTHEILDGFAQDTGDASSTGVFQEGRVLAGTSSSTPSNGDQSHNKPTGSLGVSWRFLHSEHHALTAYTNYRSAFKPAAMDFGAEVETSLLQPETSRSYEAGLKGDWLDGRLHTDLSAFYMKMKNIVVLQGNGMNPYLTNAGALNFRGAEFELRYDLLHDLQATLTGAYHDVRYGNYIRGVFDPNGNATDPFDQTGVDGRPPIRTKNVDDSGNRREFSPRAIGALGLIYTAGNGIYAQTSLNYTGRRYLDPENTINARSFLQLDAGAGYRMEHFVVGLVGHNLTNSRDAVSATELIDAQYYRNPARSIELNLAVPF